MRDGNEAMPLRLVPYATGNVISPVGLVQVLALPDTILRAYAVSSVDNSISMIEPKDWQVLSTRPSRSDASADSDCFELPANVFIWVSNIDDACDHYFMPDRRDSSWTLGERSAMAISKEVHINDLQFEDLSADFPSSFGYAKTTTPSCTSPTTHIDPSKLATRTELINAFGSFTGMCDQWFDSLKDKPALLRARKRAGMGQRGQTLEPLFCPFVVMNWLVDPKRKTGRPLSLNKGWEILEKSFPKVHAERSVGDSR